tara:strand:+ start:721 stop:1554 length:834 start_codon:yes stop_codon:yes gene_type:complete
MKTTRLIASLSLLSFIACQNNAPKQSVESKDDIHDQSDHEAHLETVEEIMLEKNGIKIYSIGEVEQFEDAKLELANYTVDSNDESLYRFEFGVSNYELKAQTNAHQGHCANSEKGQHIHFVLNNAPYEAHYEPNIESTLLEGNNVVLAFLSRSYHESIKHKNAFVLKNIALGENAGAFDESAPHLFYSRPKGEYVGDDTKRILLDFYLVNANLQADNYQVRVLIDDEEFVLDSWQAYFVEGLSMGEHTFRIQLIDQEGNLVPGPFNDSGDRIIQLKA